jgi:hypothetical protein
MFDIIHNFNVLLCFNQGRNTINETISTGQQSVDSAVWPKDHGAPTCTTCSMEGHHKNKCPTFAQYMATGMPHPLPTRGLWCELCKKPGHDPYHFPMIQKYQTVPKSSYCNFCKLVGHDDKDCPTLDLMRERTSDAYRV